MVTDTKKIYIRQNITFAKHLVSETIEKQPHQNSTTLLCTVIINKKENLLRNLSITYELLKSIIIINKKSGLMKILKLNSFY